MREHALDNPSVAEHAYGAGLITTSQYLAATRAEFAGRVDDLLIATVADTLTIDEALHVINSREHCQACSTWHLPGVHA